MSEMSDASAVLPALVLLPGMDGTGNLFAPFIEALGARCPVQVLRYPANEPLDYGQLQAWMASVLPWHQSHVLLGESFSGPLAVALAARAPPGLLGLVLCCSFVRNPRPLGRVLSPWLGLMPPLHWLPVALWMPALLGRNASPSLQAALREAVAKVHPAVLRARLRAVARVDVSAKLRAVGVPVLALQAANDLLVPPASGKYMKLQCPLLRLETLAGPHALLQVAPEAAARSVLAFMQGLLPHAIPQDASDLL